MNLCERNFLTSNYNQDNKNYSIINEVNKNQKFNIPIDSIEPPKNGGRNYGKKITINLFLMPLFFFFFQILPCPSIFF